MERLRNFTQILARNLFVFAAAIALTACGNGGSIDFTNPGTTPGTTNNRGASASFVPASQAIATAAGYQAKVQLNPLKETVLTGSGYTLKLKHTVRNR